MNPEHATVANALLALSKQVCKSLLAFRESKYFHISISLYGFVCAWTHISILLYLMKNIKKCSYLFAIVNSFFTDPLLLLAFQVPTLDSAGKSPCLSKCQHTCCYASPMFKWICSHMGGGKTNYRTLLLVVHLQQTTCHGQNCTL